MSTNFEAYHGSRGRMDDHQEHQKGNGAVWAKGCTMVHFFGAEDCKMLRTRKCHKVTYQMFYETESILIGKQRREGKLKIFGIGDSQLAI